MSRIRHGAKPLVNKAFVNRGALYMQLYSAHGPRPYNEHHACSMMFIGVNDVHI